MLANAAGHNRKDGASSESSHQLVNEGAALPEGKHFDGVNKTENPVSTYDSAEIFKALEHQADEQGLFDSLDQIPFCMEFLKYAVRPDRKERLAWDFYILCLVVYSSVQGPYFAAFVGEQSMDWLDWMVDLSFYTDIVLNFWTGFDKGFEVIMDKKAIVKNYLGGWFFIDFIATVNWDLVIAAIGQSNSDSPLIRLMRLLKVLRLARASRLINRLTASWTLHTAFIEAAKFFFYVFMVGHLLACFFYMWPMLMECERQEPDIPDVPDMSAFFPPDASGNGAGKASNILKDDAEFERLAADFEIDNAAAESLATGEGWYYHRTCMQGSWRQGYALQEICELRDPELNADGDVVVYSSPFDTQIERDILKKCYLAASRNSLHTIERSSGDPLPVSSVCVPCMDPMRLYIDAMYWSLTTMTTIGYGDRGPVTRTEIIFTLGAEVFGLCIFALLLTQINTLNEVIGESENQKNDQKNGVVQFLKNQHLSATLVEDTVRFLNFRASSLSGHAFAADADEFAMLSPGLIESIQNAVYRPVLERVRFFGWNKEDENENELVKKMFDDIDTDGGGSLDKAETNALFKKLDIHLTTEQYDQVFAELDSDGAGDIEFPEFQSWWFLKKNGKPRMPKCPTRFLDALCTKLNTQPFAKREEIVHRGDYGKSLIIILSGSVKVYRDTDEYPVLPEVESPDEEFDAKRPEEMSEVVSFDDREPIVGFASCLGQNQWAKVGNRTSDWVVHAISYVDTAWIKRPDIIECFENHWQDGQWEMIEVAKYHYEVDVKMPSDEPSESVSEPVVLEGDAIQRIDTLNAELTARIATVERNVDKKLDEIIGLLQSKV